MASHSDARKELHSTTARIAYIKAVKQSKQKIFDNFAKQKTIPLEIKAKKENKNKLPQQRFEPPALGTSAAVLPLYHANHLLRP